VAPKEKKKFSKRKNIEEPFEIERNYDYGATKDIGKKQYYKPKDYQQEQPKYKPQKQKQQQG
jgi:hypothetical protein